MEIETEVCKYCNENLEIGVEEGLKCTVCSNNVHIKCLKRKSVPGGLNGDVFFTYICEECSDKDVEEFSRDKLSWLQVIVLVLYHLNTRSPGLARKGYFHWRYHIATFIDKNWDVLFTNFVKKKKMWTGTVAGTLSHFRIYFFLSGTSVVKEQAWWTLKYPKLTPLLVTKIYNLLMIEKAKLKADKEAIPDPDIFNKILDKTVTDKSLLKSFVSEVDIGTEISNDVKDILPSSSQIKKNTKEKEIKEGKKRKNILPTIDNRKLMKYNNSIDLSDEFKPEMNEENQLDIILKNRKVEEKKENIKLLDPFCHYNTSLNNISRVKGVSLKIKLLGGLRKDLILSPYSKIYLKPYIRRDTECFPNWLKLMAEIQLAANFNNPNFKLPSRGPLDYTYVQPEHIPAINCLCNQFFWPGIDVTDTLLYPDFSCVVLYKQLVVGFAFLVPNVSHTENYLSFIFTRPGWRNVGIAKFMLYHLIQTSLGKDIILHVSINSPALFLYQKFGFKVEKVLFNFYDKYLRNDVKESKHAFYCRLER